MGTSQASIRALTWGAACAIGYAAAARPHLLRWGATECEVRRSRPGDGLLPDAHSVSTMATTLPAPPEEVWPWLVQMGCDRAGWYSWDRLDNGGRPSAERIVPQWQHLAEGDRLLSVPSGAAWFTVARIDPPRTLVLRASLELPGGRPFDPQGKRPGWYTDSLWGFHLEPHAGGSTRLVVRTSGCGRPRPLVRALGLAFWEPAHVVMQLRQFANLRRRTAPVAVGHRYPCGRQSPEQGPEAQRCGGRLTG